MSLYKAAINEAVKHVRMTDERIEWTLDNGAHVYAYPHRLGIAWGINGAETGKCIMRGIRKADGNDIVDPFTHAYN